MADSRATLTSLYRPVAGRHDEAVTAAGALADAWRPVAEGFDGLGREDMEALRRDAARLLDAQAATHLVDDEEGVAASRPWQLDPVPIAIDAGEWSRLASGIAQRLQVIDAVLDDLYGERRLLKSGTIPVEAVAGHPAYRLPLVGSRPARGPRLVVYGADLVRTADGEWRVLRDATDAPAGLGYALLYRQVLSRLLPGPFRAGAIARLAPMEAVLRAGLAEATPPGRDAARVVVLTGGTQHDSYVEHALLASRLGYHLAEAHDLAVRDGRVWLRSVEGLEPVDVVYRRLEDRASDPLELGGDDGVPGLASVARSGGVGIVNHLGSALGGSIGLLPFVDDCARTLLSESLRLPAIPSIWCGSPDGRAAVEADLGRFVLHDVSAREGNGGRAVFGDRLDGAEEAAWRALLHDEPERVVAQEYLQFATSPVLGANGLEPGVVTIRVIAVHGPDGIEVLPGGVGRVVDPALPVVAQPRGASHGVVKDVWVVGGGAPIRPRVRVDTLSPVDLRDSLPTRAAEALTWAGRHLERADAIARLVNVVVAQIADDPLLPAVAAADWARHAIGGLAAVTGTAFPTDDDVPASPDALRESISAALAGPGGLAEALRSLGRSARAARQYLARSTWSVLRDLGEAADRISAPQSAEGSSAAVEDELDRILLDLAALAGLIAESTVRGPAWRFLDIGRRVERVVLSCGTFEGMLAVPPAPAVERISLDTVLAAHESLVAYRRRYRTDPDLDNVLDLLAADDANPRSLQFQLDRLRGLVLSLPARPSRERLSELVEDAALGVAASPWFDDAVVGGRRTGVDQLVLDVRGPMLAFVDELTSSWFADTPLHRMGRGG